jgi:glutathione S-transferase
MSLTLHFHPLSSYCWKALIALYETGVPFTPQLVDLTDPAERAALLRLWPIGKFPVLRDEARDQTVPEASVIVEYLATHYPGRTQLLPADPDDARRVRLMDRIFDLHLHDQMQRVVADRLRPPADRDPTGVTQARAAMRTTYDYLEQQLAGGAFACGETFTLADCAAAPALYYGQKVEPYAASHPGLAAYLARLEARPSFARTLAEAEPYFAMFPQ